MKSGYWSKKPGQRARYISLPARQPFRKGPTRSKTINGYNRKPTYGKHMANNQGDHQVNNKYPYQAKHYDPKKHSCNKKKSMNKGNVVNLERVSSSSKIWKRPVMPYRFHIQYNRTRNIIKYPSNRMTWASAL